MNYEKAFETKHVALIAIVLMVAIAMVSLVGCGGSSSSSSSDVPEAYKDLDSQTLILSNSCSEGAAGDVWSKAIAEKVSSITGGKLTINYQGLGALGSDNDIITQEQNNDIQMVICQPASMVSFCSAYAVFDTPMAFAKYSGDQIESVLNGDNTFTQGLEAADEAAGFVNLGWLQNGTFRQTTSNTELKTLADFSGFQIRTMENKNHMAFWSAIGAEPTPLAWSEVYFALQNGTVNGQENATDTCASASLQEVQKYLCKTNHILYANDCTISKKCWDSLDSAYQAALKQAVSEATAEVRPTLTELDTTSTKKLTDGGMTVIEYDNSFFDEFVNNAGVQALYTSIDQQTGGLVTSLTDALAAAK